MWRRPSLNLENWLSSFILLVVFLTGGNQVISSSGVQGVASAQISLNRADDLGNFQTTPVSYLNCAGTSVGFKPLSDMSATDFYKDQNGGLYGNGQNSPPSSHLLMAQSKNAGITPRGAGGSPSSAGKIGLVTVGMSNTRQEFIQFQVIANADPQKSPKVVLVNGAQGGQTAERWAENADTDRPWSILMAEVEKAGLTPAQVQVVWIKLSNFNLPSTAIYPSFATKLRNDMAVTVKRLKTKFPNLQTIYFSSRIYAGYTTYQLNPEPLAYESALAARWLIQDQINGGGATGTTYANAPVLLWGPYLWADGLGPDGVLGGQPGRSDGLEWECTDFEDDGTHPSFQGEVKVANLLLNFFKTNGLAKSWFTINTGTPITPSPTLPSRVTSTPTNLKTLTPTPTLPFTASPTPTPSPTVPAREVPTSTSTITPTPTATIKTRITPSPTNVPTLTPTTTISIPSSPTPTSTPTATMTLTPTPTPTIKTRPSPTPTFGR